MVNEPIFENVRDIKSKKRNCKSPFKSQYSIIHDNINDYNYFLIDPKTK